MSCLAPVSVQPAGLWSHKRRYNHPKVRHAGDAVPVHVFAGGDQPGRRPGAGAGAGRRGCSRYDVHSCSLALLSHTHHCVVVSVVVYVTWCRIVRWFRRATRGRQACLTSCWCCLPVVALVVAPVYLNGVEADRRENVPAGTYTTKTLAITGKALPGAIQFSSTPMYWPISALTVGVNIIAVACT